MILAATFDIDELRNGLVLMPTMLCHEVRSKSILGFLGGFSRKSRQGIQYFLILIIVSLLESA